MHAVKYYPAGATTNSDSGVTSLARVHRALAAMERAGIVLSVHGEVTDADVDVFDRERVFVDASWPRIVRDFPGLRIVLEHITTREAAAVRDATRQPDVAATITPQHLLYSRNALFAGGLRPHLYCLPVLKRETHRQALVAAATSGNPKFFLGTDSAPHAQGRQGKRVRLRRLLHGAARAAALRGSVRGRRARSTGSKASRACTARRSTACRATATRSRSQRDDWVVPGRYRVRRCRHRAASRGRDAALARSPGREDRALTL